MTEKANSKSKVISLEQIRQQASPEVEIPGWEPDSMITVRLRQVSMLGLIGSGQLPNDLLALAHKLASKGRETYNPVTDSKPEELREFVQLLEVMAKASLVEPTYDEIAEAAGGLTDNQLSAIFAYCTQGLRALASFRQRLGKDEATGDGGKDVRGDSEQLPSGAEQLGGFLC